MPDHLGSEMRKVKVKEEANKEEDNIKRKPRLRRPERQRLSPSSEPLQQQHQQGPVSLSPSTDETTRQLVQQLERALACEQRVSGQLKEEVAFLRNENSKLLQDSQAAAQQLHQFTEWFFKNIHKS